MPLYVPRKMESVYLCAYMHIDRQTDIRKYLCKRYRTYKIQTNKTEGRQNYTQI